MAGRLLLVFRLLMRDLRRRRTETALLLVAISAATATLTLGLTLNELVTRPYQQTRAATAGPDVVLEPGVTGQEALDALAPLTTGPGVTGHSGPYPLLFQTLTARDLTVRVIVEGRDAAAATVDQPVATDGGWVRPGGVVVERTFADALGLTTGDTVSVEGRPLRVAGTAVTSARSVYPWVGWHLPGSILRESGGLIWVDRGDIASLAGTQRLSYTLNLTLADPQAGDAFVNAPVNHASFRRWKVATWQDIAETNSRQTSAAQEALAIGSWILTILALTGVAGIVAGRAIGQRRRVGLLKAVGAGPGMVAAVHLAEYLVIGLAAAGIGLAVGWLAAPPLFRPSAGLIGSVGVDPPPQAVLAAVALALAIAVAATLVPVIRAAATSTVHALADAATPPRRRGWRIWLSRQLPPALLIGVRVNARRPRRARLVMVNTLITTAGLAAVAMEVMRDHRGIDLGAVELPDLRDQRTFQAMFLVAGVACVLAILNTIVSTWTAVLDTRHPLAVARALGATPAQAGAGLAVAQLLPALPGVAVGIPLSRLLGRGDLHYAFAVALAVLLGVTVLTAVPALMAVRRPVADTLGSTPS